MSVRISLEKDGYIKNGFTGFSWTTFFFGFWVPIFRGKAKDFAMFFGFFILKIISFTLLFHHIESFKKNLLYGILDISYSILTPIVLLVSTFVVGIWIAYYYNKYYTDNLLAEGYNVLENDEYSAAVLKDYTYLPYSKEELADDVTMQKYEELAKLARKNERKKVYIFFGVFISIYVLLIIISILNRP